MVELAMRCVGVVPVPGAGAVLALPRGMSASGTGTTSKNEAPTLKCDALAPVAFSRFNPAMVFVDPFVIIVIFVVRISPARAGNLLLAGGH
jgi:hypothetical protein